MNRTQETERKVQSRSICIFQSYQKGKKKKDGVYGNQASESQRQCANLESGKRKW